jgi:hypothetical protein
LLSAAVYHFLSANSGGRLIFLSISGSYYHAPKHIALLTTCFQLRLTEQAVMAPAGKVISPRLPEKANDQLSGEEQYV